MIPMSFMKQSADLQPIEDTVFAVVSMAKQDIAENGADAVIDATIGSLYDEQGRLVAYQNVFDHYNAIAKEVKAAYAASFTGNPGYRAQVKNWVAGSADCAAHLRHRYPRRHGRRQHDDDQRAGAGADGCAAGNLLGLVQSDGCPGGRLKTASYAMFDGDHFNIASLEAVCRRVMNEQGRLLVVVNDPCHNPTGYSMDQNEWRQLVDLLNELSKQGPCVILNDIAYIDYSYRGRRVPRDYLTCLNAMNENVLAVIAFSCSKTLTSYGLRCGAALVLGQNEQRVREAEIVFEKPPAPPGATSPTPRWKTSTWITTENREAFEAEKQTYVDLLNSAALFYQEAAACVTAALSL